MSYAALVGAKQFYNGSIQNTNAPVFSGIQSTSANNDSSLNASWNAATGSAQAPIRYAVYIMIGSVSAAALFINGNKIGEFSGLTAKIYALANGSFLLKNQIYTLGVRALSGNSISETNTVILTDTCIGVSVLDVPSLVWDQLKSAHSISGSFGEYLDAKVSLTQTTATALTQYNALVTAIGTIQTTATALSQYNALISAVGTPQQASTALTQYNALQTAIGLVQTASTALSQYGALISAIGSPQQAATAATQYNNLQTAIGLVQSAAVALSQFNTIVSGISSAISEINQIPTNPLLDNDTRLNHLDADISSRLADADYVEPNNADVAAIKERTDRLPDTPADEKTSKNIFGVSV